MYDQLGSALAAAKDEGTYFLLIVTALGSGEFTHNEQARFGSRRSAVEAAEQLQSEFDADCEPRRVYVLGADRVPIWAGGARGRPKIPAQAR